MSPSKGRSVIDGTPVRGFVEGGPLAQAILKTLPLDSIALERETMKLKKAA